MSNVRAMDPQAEMRWIPKIDRELPENEQLTIHYHPLDMRKEAKLSDGQIKSITKGRKSSYEYLVSQADVTRLEEAIYDWENLNYPEDHSDSSLAGKKVPFSKENIAVIPPEIRTEFITFVTGRDRLKDEDDEEGSLGEAKTA